MGKDSKPKDAGGKGKGKAKQGASGADESASKGKGKSGKAASDGLGTCTYVKARHILSEKQGKINEAYKKLQDGWLSNGDKVPPAEFAKLAAEYSECPSGKKGGDLGWFPRGKMAGPFQEVAFATQVGVTSAPFKSTYVLSPTSLLLSIVAIDFSILIFLYAHLLFIFAQYSKPK
uniref:Peptidyl-prolyl cis-trans isomerase n=1 Tax=Cucumis sativus TaxID=3659 RepID=A0A0A0KNJ8_CUCSA